MNNGIPYFPLDVHLDDKIELIEAEFGLTGFAVVVKLFQKIYGGQGYYCEWTNDVALLFSRSVGLGCNVVSEIVSAAVRRGIFDKDIFDKYQVLTSRGIQKRYFEAVSRRKNVEAKKAYLLIKLDQKYENVNILSGNADILKENADRNGQRKEEKRKVKERRAEKTKAEERDGGAAAHSKELQRVIVRYEENISPITSIVKDYMSDCLKYMDAEVLIYAIDEAVKHNARNWAYIEAVLRRQYNAGNTTLAQVKAANERRTGEKQPREADCAHLSQDRIEAIMRQKYGDDF